jgi:hypothetical protein
MSRKYFELDKILLLKRIAGRQKRFGCRECLTGFIFMSTVFFGVG